MEELQQNQEQGTSISKQVWKDFLGGFFFTAGTMAAVTAFTYRQKIGRVVKAAIQEAK